MENNYLKDALEFYKRGRAELIKAKKIKDEKGAQNACAKAWLAVVNATKWLFLTNGIREEELPKSYRGMTYLLNKYAGKEMVRDFIYFFGTIHVGGYYNGYIYFDILSEDFRKIKNYIDKIKSNSIKPY